MGVKIVGLKLGKDGCQLTTREKQIHIPGIKINVIDTTGAGDAFSAAMIYGFSQDWSLEVTGMLANSMGGLASTHWGAGAALPTTMEVVEYLKNLVSKTNDNNILIQELIGKLQ